MGLDGITRREFGLSTFFGAALPALVLPREAEAQQNRIADFKRGTPIDVQRLPITLADSSKQKYEPTEEDKKSYH